MKTIFIIICFVFASIRSFCQTYTYYTAVTKIEDRTSLTSNGEDWIEDKVKITIDLDNKNITIHRKEPESYSITARNYDRVINNVTYTRLECMYGGTKKDEPGICTILIGNVTDKIWMMTIVFNDQYRVYKGPILSGYLK